MEEQLNYFPHNEDNIVDEQKNKLCKKVLITTIIIDVLFFTWIWIIWWLIYLAFIISYKKELDSKCFKKILIIWFVPIILILLAFWWCLLIFLPYL